SPYTSISSSTGLPPTMGCSLVLREALMRHPCHPLYYLQHHLSPSSHIRHRDPLVVTCSPLSSAAGMRNGVKKAASARPRHPPPPPPHRHPPTPGRPALPPGEAPRPAPRPPNRARAGRANDEQSRDPTSA